MSTKSFELFDENDVITPSLTLKIISRIFEFLLVKSLLILINNTRCDWCGDFSRDLFHAWCIKKMVKSLREFLLLGSGGGGRRSSLQITLRQTWTKVPIST